MDLNYIDIILLVLLAYGIIKGLINGFIIELASIAALFFGVWGAIHFSDAVGAKLSQYIDWDEKNLAIAAFILTFIIIVIAVSFLAKALTQVVSMVFLGWLNRLIGGVFGFIKMSFILSILLMITFHFNSKFDFIENNEIAESKLVELVLPIAPSVLPFLKDLNFEEFWDDSYKTVEEIVS